MTEDQIKLISDSITLVAESINNLGEKIADLSGSIANDTPLNLTLSKALTEIAENIILSFLNFNLNIFSLPKICREISHVCLLFVIPISQIGKVYEKPYTFEGWYRQTQS